jgi:hypothetical protein
VCPASVKILAGSRPTEMNFSGVHVLIPTS